MFTGIVERAARIRSVTGNEQGKTFCIETTYTDHSVGESILIDGVCSTIIELHEDSFVVFYMPETLRLTTLDTKHDGDIVNIERSMTMQTLISGHLVTGHVDTTAQLVSIVPDGEAYTLTFRFSLGMQYLVHKGSICLNGISLTVINPHDDVCSVSIIPHTWQVTNLHTLTPGDPVNVEFDMIAKHIERQLQWRNEK